ncbi:MAG TPA: MBL fold metallo-hydrolase [Ktedonosporobacter sp.]|nr:MBL fold metallo-hydrolase [Ktedonosporobacter sp.]
MDRILNGIWSIEGLRMGRIYVIEAADGLTLVDTSVPGSLPQIEKELQRVGHHLSDVKRILITHAHSDHFGSLAALKEVTGARVYAHARHESAVIRGEKEQVLPPRSQLNWANRLQSRLLRTSFPTPAQVDYELKEGDRLDEVLPGLEVIDEPGHSPGQCGFWQAEQRLLFGGDVMMNIPFGLSLPVAYGTPDMDEAKRSIGKVAEMNVATLCLGHGKPLVSMAAPAIRAFVNKLGL